MSEITGPGSQQPSYKAEFKESLNLFEKSFQGMQSSHLDAQKAQYVKVMQESLKIIKEAADGMLNQHVISPALNQYINSMKEKLSQDLNTYLANPTDENREHVQIDINQLKKE